MALQKFTRSADKPYVTSAPHVVLIEDDDDVRQLVSTWLLRLGCRVTECPTGQRGLKAITQAQATDPVDLVLLDVLLPDLDGRDIYRRLRRIGDIPVLVMSIVTEGFANITPLSDKEAVLAKPFRRSDFERAVRRLISLPACGRTGSTALSGGVA